MDRIFVKMFGIPEIRIKGERLNPTLKRIEALLYYLTINRRVSREEVIDLLWETDDLNKSRKNLRNLLYKLNKDLGFELLISINRETLIVNPDVEFKSDYTEYLDGDRKSSKRILENFTLKKAPKFEKWKENIFEVVDAELACI